MNTNFPKGREVLSKRGGKMKLVKVLLALLTLLALAGCPEMLKQPGRGGAGQQESSGGGD